MMHLDMPRIFMVGEFRPFLYSAVVSGSTVQAVHSMPAAVFACLSKYHTCIRKQKTFQEWQKEYDYASKFEGTWTGKDHKAHSGGEWNIKDIRCKLIQQKDWTALPFLRL